MPSNEFIIPEYIKSITGQLLSHAESSKVTGNVEINFTVSVVAGQPVSIEQHTGTRTRISLINEDKAVHKNQGTPDQG